MKDPRFDPMQEMLRAVTRRHFFRQAGFGIGSAALTALLGNKKVEMPYELIKYD